MVQSGVGLEFYLPIYFCMFNAVLTGDRFIDSKFMFEYFNVNTIWRNSLEAAETFFFSLALCRCSFFALFQYFYIYTQNYLAKQ